MMGLNLGVTFTWQLIVILLSVCLCNGSHFRGGTISWKPTGHGNEVEFTTKTGWVYTYCNETLMNQYSLLRTVLWECASGCAATVSSVNDARSGSVCTGASKAQDWEKAENVFRYTFPGSGPFTIEYASAGWIASVGGGSWRIATTVDLRARSDTGEANYSPVVTSKPIYNVKFGCTSDVVLSVLDADMDNVRCRWATGQECVSVCHQDGAAAVATLDPITCRVTIHANENASMYYAVAIMVEDRPKNTIAIGGQTYTPNDVISSVPMQFLVTTPDLPTRVCSDKPAFVAPTPGEGVVIVVKQGETFYLSFYATSRQATITSFSLLDPPPNVRQSAVRTDDQFRHGVYAVDLKWTPRASDKGRHTLCVEATDNFVMSSQICITIVAWDKDPCESGPCMFNGTCIRDGYTDDFSCSCMPGYTGIHCEHVIPDPCRANPCLNWGNCSRVDMTSDFMCACASGFDGKVCEIDIDECESDPCFNNGTCFDLVNGFFCRCAEGFSGLMCETDINECISQPCENGGTCVDLIAKVECLCATGYNGNFCESDINECASDPCFNNGTCFDMVNGYFCGCIEGFTGFMCDTDIDECIYQPCQNGATCVDQTARAECLCPPGYYGTVCQSGYNRCTSKPCQNGATCHYDNVTGYRCACANGWLGKNCDYRFENNTVSSNKQMIYNNMAYSECNCGLGNIKRDKCSLFNRGKLTGYGVLGATLGILTAILFYALHKGTLNRQFPCLKKMIDHGGSRRVVSIQVAPVETPGNAGDEDNVIRKNADEDKRVHRHRKCYACNVVHNYDFSKPIWMR